jgi:hypothetical protein
VGLARPEEDGGLSTEYEDRESGCMKPIISFSHQKEILDCGLLFVQRGDFGGIVSLATKEVTQEEDPLLDTSFSWT